MRKKHHNETHHRRETFSEIIRTDRLCQEKSPVKNDYTMPAQSLERNRTQYYQIKDHVDPLGKSTPETFQTPSVHLG